MIIIYDYWLLLMIFIADYYWWLLKNIVIANFSSNINEVIRPILNFLLSFFYDKISQIQKSPKKHQKELKSSKKHQKVPKSIKKHRSGKK